MRAILTPGARPATELSVCALRQAARFHTLPRTMDELVSLVVQKTGISQEDAQKAVQAIVSFLKTSSPALSLRNSTTT